jgi:hypothetical protein
MVNDKEREIVPENNIEKTEEQPTELEQSFMKTHGGKGFLEALEDEISKLEGKSMLNPVASVESMIRIADVVDTEFPELAKVLDKYIEEYSKNTQNLSEFPSFGAVITEDPVLVE